MEQKIFIFLLILIQVFRNIFVPPLLILVFPFLKKIRQRFFFELKNKYEVSSRSFYKDASIAEIAFEVSSEGEFEQIRPLLDKYLAEGKRVELLYSSESLEGKLLELTKEHSKLKNLRILRLPLLTYGEFFNLFLGTVNISNWISSSHLILCRYDFYPELLIYGHKKIARFTLVSATLKNKEKISWWDSQTYQLFDYILTATERDSEKFKRLGIKREKQSSYEFRVLQITQRLLNKEAVLDPVAALLKWAEEVPRQKRIIFGSFWPSESELFSDPNFKEKISSGELRVVLLPHLIKGQAPLTLAGMKVYEINSASELEQVIKLQKEAPGIINLKFKGILCELYSSFGHSFVGGGHGRSIHSVLEPFLAGSHVYCGPKIHRSTEYEFIEFTSPEDITIVPELSGFYELYENVPEKDLRINRKRLGNSSLSSFDEKLSLLMGRVRK